MTDEDGHTTLLGLSMNAYEGEFHWKKMNHEEIPIHLNNVHITYKQVFRVNII